MHCVYCVQCAGGRRHLSEGNVCSTQCVVPSVSAAQWSTVSIVPSVSAVPSVYAVSSVSAVPSVSAVACVYAVSSVLCACATKLRARVRNDIADLLTEKWTALATNDACHLVGSPHCKLLWILFPCSWGVEHSNS